MTRDMYRKSSDRHRLIFIGGAAAVAGAIVMSLAGGIGSIGLLIGLFVAGLGVIRGRRPVVSMEATRVLLNFAAPLAIPFHSIASVDLLQTQDLALSLQSGARVVIPLSKLEEQDGAWLKKQLRREVRLAGKTEAT